MRTVVWPDRVAIRARLDAEFARLLVVLDAREDVEQVWRIGSSLDGYVHATSDLDVLVVQRTGLHPVDRAVALRAAIAPTVPLDLFVVTPEELEAGSRFLDHARRHGQRVR